MRNTEKVNLFQARMKEVTRQMMSCVSELSMYQATAMKLNEECELMRDAAAEARERSNIIKLRRYGSKIYCGRMR